jgi:hypothetical protein
VTFARRSRILEKQFYDSSELGSQEDSTPAIYSLSSPPRFVNRFVDRAQSGVIQRLEFHLDEVAESI